MSIINKLEEFYSENELKSKVKINITEEKIEDDWSQTLESWDNFTKEISNRVEIEIINSQWIVNKKSKLYKKKNYNMQLFPQDRNDIN